MRTEPANWSEPVLAVLRDPQNAPLRRQIPIGLVLSLLAHVLIVGIILVLAYLPLLLRWLIQLLIALLLMLHLQVPESLAELLKQLSDPPPARIEFARAKPKLKPMEIELIPLPPEEPKLFTLAERDKPEYLDSTGLAEAEKAPDKPTFESDQDMAAASMNAPTGTAPLPSMEGRKDMSFTNFKSQNALLGPKPELFPRDIALAAAPAPPTPIYKPQPVREPKAEQPAPPEKQPNSETPPVPEKPSPMTPDNLKHVELPNENQFPLPPKKPKVPEPIMPPSKPRPSTELAKLVPPEAKPAYQSSQVQTKIEGSVSNRGAASVDAVKTPLGVFKRKISEAIGSRWHYYMKQRNDLVTVGLARVTFFVTKDGRVQDVRVIDNSSNDMFAFACKQSILEAELPPAPPEAFDAMKDERMEITFTFNLYPN